MPGIFPDSGVIASAAMNTVDVPTTCPTTELFHSTSRCLPRFDPAAANALMSELLNFMNSVGHVYDCSTLTNLTTALGLQASSANCNCPPSISAAIPVAAPAATVSRFHIQTTATGNVLFYWNGTAWARVGSCNCPPDTGPAIPTVAPTPTGSTYYVRTTATGDVLYWWNGTAWSPISGAGAQNCNCPPSTSIGTPPTVAPSATSSPYHVRLEPTGNILYWWDGTAWERIGSCHCPPARGAVPPTVAPSGGSSLYYVEQSATGDILHWYDNAAWRMIGSCNCPPATGAVAPTVAPAATASQYYINTTTTPHTMYYWNGSAWNAVGSASTCNCPPSTSTGVAPTVAPAATASPYHVRLEPTGNILYWWDGTAWERIGSCHCPPTRGTVPPTVAPVGGSSLYYVEQAATGDILHWYDNTAWRVIGSCNCPPTIAAVAPTAAPAPTVSPFYLETTGVVNNLSLWDPVALVWRPIGGGGSTCPAPMTRAALLALRTAGTLSVQCHYVITDHVQGRLVAGTEILLHAVSATELSQSVHVNTTYDNEAWAGLYDIDAGIVTELRDNRMNIIRGVTGVEVANFDWGNTGYSNVTVDHATLTLTIGGVVTVNSVTVDKAAALIVTGFTGTLGNANITQESVVTLSGANGTWRNFTVKEFSILNAATYTGGGTQERFTIAGASNINISARAGAVTLQDSNFIAADVIATGLAATRLLTFINCPLIGPCVINQLAGGRSVQINSSTITGNAVINADTGPMNITSSRVDSGAILTTNTVNGATITLLRAEVSANSQIVNSGTGTITSTNGRVTSGTVITIEAGSTQGYTLGTTYFSSSTVQTNGPFTAGSLTFSFGGTMANNCTMTRFAAYTGSFQFRYAEMRNFCTINMRNGVRDYIFDRPDIANAALVELQGTGVGRDSMAGLTMNRGFLTLNSTGVGNNGCTDIRISGQGEFILTGNTADQNPNRIFVSDGSFRMTDCNAVGNLVLFLDISTQASVVMSNITGAITRSLNNSSASNNANINITGPHTVAGSAASIHVTNVAVFNQTLAAGTATRVLVNGGTLTHNGGNLTDVIKEMSGTLITGNFNHNDIQRRASGAKTLTAANNNLADYQGLAPQLI